MLLPGSDTYLLEVSAQVSLKVATKGNCSGKTNFEDFDFNVGRSVTKKIEVSLINLTLLYLV